MCFNLRHIVDHSFNSFFWCQAFFFAHRPSARGLSWGITLTYYSFHPLLPCPDWTFTSDRGIELQDSLDFYNFFLIFYRCLAHTSNAIFFGDLPCLNIFMETTFPLSPLHFLRLCRFSWTRTSVSNRYNWCEQFGDVHNWLLVSAQLSVGILENCLPAWAGHWSKWFTEGSRDSGWSGKWRLGRVLKCIPGFLIRPSALSPSSLDS